MKAKSSTVKLDNPPRWGKYFWHVSGTVTFYFDGLCQVTKYPRKALPHECLGRSVGFTLGLNCGGGKSQPWTHSWKPCVFIQTVHLFSSNISGLSISLSPNFPLFIKWTCCFIVIICKYVYICIYILFCKVIGIK